MGAGKSTLGPPLAEALELPFVDLDARIVARAGASIPAIFAERGEAGFRRLERRELAGILAGPPLVLATGGGAPVQPRAMAALKRWGTVVFLEVGIEELERRAAGSGRPLFDAGAAELLSARTPGYRSADLVIDGDRPVGRLVAGILEALQP